MRLLITGGTGVLGRALRPLAEPARHEFEMPGREELDLFDPAAVAHAESGVDGVLHLATRIRTLDQISDPEAWRDNDRLRAERRGSSSTRRLPPGCGLRPAHRYLRLPAERAGLRGHAHRRGPADLRPSLAARSRPSASHAPAGAAWSCDSGCSTVPAPGTTSRRATSVPRCTSPTPGALSFGPWRCPAVPTTSAATVSASRPSASPAPAGWRPEKF